MIKENSRNYGMLLLLVCLFIAPGLGAYVFYMHPQWLPHATTNKGELLTPPILLQDLSKSTKWRLILWSPTACDKKCMHQVDKLARVRLALGRRLYHVETWLLIGDDEKKLPVAYANTLIEQDVLFKRLSDAKRLSAYTDRKIFIANEDNYLVLAYSASTKPADIFHDMKQLLTTTEK